MKSAELSIKVPIPKTAPPQRVALKIQRRCYGRDALTEIGIHHYLRRDHGPSPDLIGFHEAFFHDGHVCTSYELHGRSLDTFVDRGPLPLNEVRAITHLITAPVHGAVNLTAPAPVTQGTFTKTLGKVLHRPTVLPIPKFGPKLLLGGELANALLFTGQKVLPKVLIENGFTFQHATLEQALRSILGRAAA